MTDKTGIRTVLQSSRIVRYGLWLVAAFVLFGILGFLALPPIVKHVAADKLGEALHRPVSIERVGIDPYALTLTVEGLKVEEREGGETFAGFDSLYVNLQASSLFRGGPVIREIRLLNPTLRIARLAENRYNFSDLVDEFSARPKEKDDAHGPAPAFSLNNIQISGGRIEFDDRLIGEKHVAGNIALTLPFVSSMDYATETFVEPHFSALVNGAQLKLEGKSKPFTESRESEFLLKLDDVQLPKYFGYSPVKLPMKLESGVLATNLTLVFGQEPGKMPRLVVSGTAAVDHLNVTGATGQALAAVKRLDVAVASADVFGGRFAIGRVALDSPEIAVRATPEGTLNWLDLLPEAAVSGKPSGTIEWSLAEVKISGGALRWDDESNSRVFQAEFKDIDAWVKHLDGQGSVADFEAAWKVDGGESLKVDSFAVKEGKLDLAKRRDSIGDVHLESARALITRLADGRVEWIEPPTLRLAASAHEDASASWTAEVAKFTGKGVGIRFEDAAVSPKATQSIEDLDFELSGVSTEPERMAEVKTAFKFNRKGQVAVDGKLGIMPLDADLNLSVKTIDILPLQAYFSDRLNVGIKRGHVTADARMQLRWRAGEVQTGVLGGAGGESGALTGSFTGKLTVGDFQAVDKADSTEFLRWKSFQFGKVDARLGPESVSIGEIALANFFARVLVSREGKLNLFNIVRQDKKADDKPGVQAAESGSGSSSGARVAESPDGKATASVAVESQAALPVKIGKITLRGGHVRFTDNFVKPNYTANLREVSGSVTGLSSAPESQARLELRGSYDKVAPLTVSARINPLSAKPYLDLQADLKGIDLTSLSAYSGKYAGYVIDKGKLSLSVKYRIENDQLEAENRVFLDQLTFGDAVESPDATALPVRLAASLLKNRNGEIDINLPISGSLNDPQFSVGGLIVEMVVNLLMKAATSPFALIGSMFGGEELDDVGFDSGRAALTPEAVKRLENLAKALVERPALKFEIEGWADPDQDTDGLKRARIERKLRALKREDRAEQEKEQDEESVPAGSVAVTEQEYPDLLERVYQEESFPKPRNMFGMVKSLPVEEMEKLILDNSAVSADDLKNLGDRRAKAVRDWLIAHEVAAERIFLLPSKLSVAGDGKSGRRADFSLK
ncbi:MAG: DUF748 domain-containing protein [Candidatus Accumulibacter sp.]|nr:DUF748 domain-containing protein [Accumulibacter sp.]